MSKELFKESIEAARQVMAITAQVEGEDGPLKRLSEKQQDQVQVWVAAGRASLIKAAKVAKFASADAARAAIRALPSGDFDILRAFAERNMPVDASTRLLAEALAPGRVAALGALKASPFGAFLGASEPEAKAPRKGAAKPSATEEEGDDLDAPAKVSRAEAARALESKTLKEQTNSFQALAHAFGKGMPGARVMKGSIATVPGTKVVEGAKMVAAPVASLPPEALVGKDGKPVKAKKLTQRELFELSQMKLFSQADAPVPADAEQKRGRGRPKGSGAKI